MHKGTAGAETQQALEQRWGHATVAVIHAQTDYESSLATHGVDDLSTTAAWLRLWRAQEQQRQVSAELDRYGD